METKFTKTNLWVRLVLFLGVFTTFNASAQSCACKETVQVSLDEDGEALVTASMLLAMAVHVLVLKLSP